MPVLRLLPRLGEAGFRVGVTLGLLLLNDRNLRDPVMPGFLALLLVRAFATDEAGVGGRATGSWVC